MGRRERTVRLEPGIFGRYYGSGKRSIQVHFTFRGVRCRETMPGLDPAIKNNVKFAVNTLAAIQRDIDKGVFDYLAYFPESKRARIFGHAVSSRTVKDVARSWLADMKRSLPHSTYRSYAGPCKSFIYPEIGDKRIRDVTVEDLRRMFREADITLKTARNYSIPLRAIFDRAIDDDDINRNPMDRIKVKSLIPNDRHKSDYLIDPFSQDEIDAILDACRKHRPAWLNYFTFAFYTGLRTCELYGLEWRDVDWRSASIQIARAVVEYKPKGPKTAAGLRTVVLCDEALASLKRHRAVTELVGAPIFRNPTTGETLTRYEVSERAFDYCQQKAGVRRRNQYQTRHTYASHMLSEGVNPMYVAAQMGHKNTQMLFRVYAKWISGSNQGAVSYGKRAENVTQITRSDLDPAG